MAEDGLASRAEISGGRRSWQRMWRVTTRAGMVWLR